MKRGIAATALPMVCILTSCARDEEEQQMEVADLTDSASAPPDARDVVTPQRSFDSRLQPGALERASDQAAKNEREAAEQEVEDSEVELPNPPADAAGRELAVAEEILTLPQGDARSLALTELMRRWVEKDPEAAWAFREQVEVDKSGSIERAFYRGIMPYMAKNDSELVRETVESGAW